MSKSAVLHRALNHPDQIFLILGTGGYLNWLSDERYLRMLYRFRTGKKLRLDNPITFNEKLQWLKIYDRNEKYPGFVDKITAKEIVGHIIGEKHIVPIYGVWNNADDINFDMLPNQFVLKCNHDQGSVVLIHDKESFDREKAVNFLNSKIKKSPFPGTREYAYKSIVPKVFAEKYLGGAIIDYKFYCFNGEPLFLYCGRGLTADHSLKIDFFDMNWNLMPFYRTDYERLGAIPKPDHFNEMISIAKELSKDIPFVRIDLFEVNDCVYFSEFTLCPAAGFMPFVPEKYDEIVGSWLTLPVMTNNKNTIR